jgi:rhodanese-related sulfurtransferase
MKGVTPEEARALMDGEGFAYIDVRSVPEFEAGHPSGAYNVPLLHMTRMGMAPNPDFMAVMQSRFPSDAKLVVGCKSGGRSHQAAALLQAAGYTQVVELPSGFEGAFHPSGRIEPGWRPRGLPVATQAEPGHSYEALLAKP